MSVAFDPTDLFRFAPVGFRQATTKGFVSEKEGILWKKRYFALFGNLLYRFDSEESSKLTGVEFLEYSTLRSSVSTTDGTQFLLVITTVGGKTITFSFSSAEERKEWHDYIEANKFISLTRRLEDSEAKSVQLNHRVELQDMQTSELERTLVATDKDNQALRADVELKENRIRELQLEVAGLKTRLRNIEEDKAMLLKSRGITPKKIPTWAMSVGSDGNTGTIDAIKLWCGTWNLSSHEPLAGLDRAKAHRALQPFIPSSGYDMYVLGVQECPTDALMDCLDGLFSSEGILRLRVDGSAEILRRKAATASGAGGGGGVSSSSTGDSTKLLSRGDGALLNLKFIGIAIYLNRRLISDTKVLGVFQKAYSASVGQGFVVVALSVLGRTIAFVSCQLDSKRIELRREQVRELLIEAGEALGEPGYLLNEQFHHIICLGDLGYGLVDTSGNSMPSEMVVKMLEDGLNRTLFSTHDELNREKTSQLSFYAFREPTPFPNFFPTYKKVENRLPMDYSSSSWVRQSYDTILKMPFYMGGSARDVSPRYSDRVLFHSMVDLAEDLIPESISQELVVHLVDDWGEDLVCGASSASSTQTPPRHSERPTSRSGVGSTSVVSQSSRRNVTMKDVVINNYRSINDGEALNASTHAPVFAGFILRLRHDHDELRKFAAPVSSGNIETLLSALHLDNPTQSPSAVVPAPLPPPLSTPSSSGLTRAVEEFRLNQSSQTAGATEGLPNQIRGYKYSLLPPGSYTVRLSNCRLFWGTQEENPRQMQVLFPAPYESVAGESFAEFFSEPVVSDSLSTPLPATSPTKSSVRPSSGPARGVPTFPSSGDGTWVKTGMSLSASSLSLKSRAPDIGSAIPALQLTWKGDEPLDRLHVVVKAGLPASSFSPTTSGKAEDSSDWVYGHCAFGLEQLCKTALLTSGGVTGRVTVPRLLLREGLPLYRVDERSLQREQVTLMVTLELLPAVSNPSTGAKLNV